MNVKLEGADRVINEFTRMALNPTPQHEFIDTISKETLFLLRQNTPIDTGELRNSWHEVMRTNTMVAIGTRPDQIPKLTALVFGTRYMKPQDFLTPILNFIMSNADFVMRSKLKSSHRYLSNISSGQRGTSTPSNIVGLTGTRFVKRRGRGRSYLGRIRTGRKTNRRRIGLRRSV